MTRQQAQQIQDALAVLHERLDRDRLHTEQQRARREFFGERTPSGEASELSSPAGQRFLEWFLLERESAVLGAVPAATLPLDGELSLLADSTVGVFVVGAVTGETVEALDLQDDETLELLAPAGTLRTGDLLVGRLFARPDGAWLPSAAVAVFRPGDVLAAAFRRDVERLALDRRLQQVELEHLLLRPHHARVGASPTARAAQPPVPPTTVPLEHLEAELDQLLERADATPRASAISLALEQAARPGPVIGPLLDELAFETDIDLDRVRELLVEIWNAHHLVGDGPAPAATVEPPPERPGETLGERLVRTLDEGIAQHRDLGEVFAQMEAMAGIEPDPEDDERNPFDDEGDEEAGDDDDLPRSDDEDEDGEDGEDAGVETRYFGDLQPLVQEYLWETGLPAEGDAARTLTQWAELQEQTGSRRDLEMVTAQDLMRLLLHVYLAQPPAGRAGAVRAAHAAIAAFYAWAETTQELPPQAALAECRGGLLDDLERLQAVGVGLSTPSPSARLRPALLRVEDVGPAGFGVRDDEGGDYWLDTSPATAASLRVGDLLLAALVPVRDQAELRGMVVALPADAEALIG